MAFFPCTRFENQIMMWFRGDSYGQRNWDIAKKMNKCMTLQDELTINYKLVNKLFLLCMKRGLRLIMENPYSQEHYLRRYWCFEPSVIDTDRRIYGDYFKKPTQYWFLNIKAKNNPIRESVKNNAINVKDPMRLMTKSDISKMGTSSIKTARSMIHPDYANRFIRKYIL